MAHYVVQKSGHTAPSTKGQLKSEYIYEVIDFPK